MVAASLLPPPVELDAEGSDKLGHLAAYGVLAFWFCQLYAARTAQAGYCLGFVALGVALELAQGQTGYRSFELADMGANTLGVLLGWAGAVILPRVLPAAGKGTP